MLKLEKSLISLATEPTESPTTAQVAGTSMEPEPAASSHPPPPSLGATAREVFSHPGSLLTIIPILS